MKTSSDSKPAEWSGESALLLGRYMVVTRAVERFWLDWRTIMETAGRELEAAGMIWHAASNEHDRWGLLQVAKPHWPKPFQNGIHYEVWIDHLKVAKTAAALLYLDIEDGTLDTKDKEVIAEAVKRVLLPYEVAGVLQRETGCRLPYGPTCRLFEQSIPLAGITSMSLAQAFRRIAPISALVDKAAFVRQGRPIWRTDFLPGDPKPKLTFSWPHGYPSDGGQSLQEGGGCLGNGSVRIDGTQKGNHNEANGRPTHIMTLDCTNAFANGEEVYLSCVLRASEPGKLWFLGEGHKVLPDGKLEFPPLLEAPHWHEIPVSAKPDWQHVGYRARVNSPADYSFAEGGAYVYLQTQTKESNLTISSIEIGRC